MRFQSGQDTDYQLEQILNGGVDFLDNIKGGIVEITTTGGEQEVDHGLPFTPMGFIIILRDGPVDVYATRVSEWSRQKLYLVSSASNHQVRLYVM